MSNGRLTFDIPGLRGAAVPVEVRDPRGANRRSVLSSASLDDLPPGKYFVAAWLPNGVELSAAVEVAAGATTNVVFADERTEEALSQGDVDADQPGIEGSSDAAASPEPFESASAAGEALFHTARKVFARRASNALYRSFRQRDDSDALKGREVAAPAATTWVGPAIRLLSGNLLGGELAPAPLEPSPSDAGGQWTIVGGEQPQFVEVLTERGTNVYVALPAGRDADGGRSVNCELEIVLEPALDIRVRLQDAEADVLLRYDEAGMTKQSRSLASQAWTAERLLQDKVRDPIAAAVGGYTLLRSGEVERLHNWTRNLASWVKWLPDGLVIYAEHLALVGKHEEALRQLLQLPSRGLPLFSVGLSKAIGRLQLYANATFGDEGEEQAEGRQGQAEQLRQKLQAYASVCEFKNPLTNFLGRDPLRPSSPDA